MPSGKMITIIRICFLRPVSESIVLARKAIMARRPGLKPAKRPAVKMVAVVDRVRS
jgi:hypothetical protein